MDLLKKLYSLLPGQDTALRSLVKSLESALENIGQGLEIMSAFDVLLDWLDPKDYPEWEDIPEIVPLS